MLLEWLINFVGNPVVILIGSFTIIQIAPIKLNPWTWLGKIIRKAIVGDSLEKIQADVQALKKDVLDERVSSRRWQILNFANSCIQGILHTKEEWDHCLSDLEWYEDYCEKHDVQNGVMRQCSVYLKNKYQQHMINNDFLRQN